MFGVFQVGAAPLRVALAAVLIAAGFAVPAAAQDGAAALVRASTDFYTVALALKHGGIPDKKERAKLKPLISPELSRLLADGARAETDYARNTKGEAPPLLEGDLFVSLFEGASRFRIGTCEVHGGAGQCPVALTYLQDDEKPKHWTDTVLLIATPDGWRVDDIDYGGTWPFSNTGTLKENLAFAIQNARGAGD